MNHMVKTALIATVAVVIIFRVKALRTNLLGVA